MCHEERKDDDDQKSEAEADRERIVGEGVFNDQ
jgi:hypothetical protein